MSPDHNAAPTDFDVIKSRWRVAHSRLNARLAGCMDWTSFAGRTATPKAHEDYGNVDESRPNVPDRSVRAISLRSFDSALRRRVVGWIGGRSTHQPGLPAIADFADDTLAGHPMRARLRRLPNVAVDGSQERLSPPGDVLLWATKWAMRFAQLERCCSSRDFRAASRGRLICSTCVQRTMLRSRHCGIRRKALIPH